MTTVASINFIDLSTDLLRCMKRNENAKETIGRLNQIKFGDLFTGLSNDKLKLSFWMNIYNAYFLYLRKVMGLKRPSIYTLKVIKIAGEVFSLDDIEHGILRKYRWKYSQGYLPTIKVRRIIRLLSVDKIDYRIHFALNCGAKSCPPIAFYSPQNVDEKLDVATEEFLKHNTVFSNERKEVYVSRLFLWYKADFGGKKGIRRLLEDVFDKDLGEYKIRHQKYDWTEVLDNFAPE